MLLYQRAFGILKNGLVNESKTVLKTKTNLT